MILADNVYEGMFILDANKYGRDPTGISGNLADVIKKHGGEILASRLWEERRLAYPIAGQRKGAYWLMYVKMDGRKLTGINRDCEINETILRHMFLRVDPRIAETLVSHALSGKVVQSRAQDIPTPGEPVAVGAGAGVGAGGDDGIEGEGEVDDR
jgi:small subunit ribosomal protein S6